MKILFLWLMPILLIIGSTNEANARSKKKKGKAKTGAYSYVGISKTTHQDESGNTVDYTDEEKEELAAKVADFAKAAKEDGLDAAAEDAGYTVSTGTFTQEDDSVDDNLLAALKNLKEGEVQTLRGRRDK